jgi:hypothetical protein
MNLAEIIGRPPNTGGDSHAPWRVVSFELSDDCSVLSVWEECDEYFGIGLTPDEVDRLIAWLQVRRLEMPS